MSLSPALAGEAPPERLAYVALLSAGDNGTRDALGVVDTDPTSPEYGRLVGKVDVDGLDVGFDQLRHGLGVGVPQVSRRSTRP